MKELFREIINRTSVPERKEFLELVDSVLKIFDSEDKSIRPDSDSGKPGGIIHLYEEIPTVVIPDLHARREFFGTLADLQFDGEDFFKLMDKGLLQVVCVGDGFHREVEAKERWIEAFSEYEKNFRKHQAMDAEMTESLGLMEIVMHMKIAYPRNFHFLKGNHENIKNEESGGDHPFRKFAYEGDMVKTWTLQFMGEDFLENYSCFEKKMPLLAIGSNFLVSHAEPQRFFNPSEIRNSAAAAIHGLTWTANGEAENGSVRDMLDTYLPDLGIEEKLYFGGHRIITEKYRLRADGLYVQIHNPWKFQVAYVKPGKEIDLEKDIMELAGMDNG